MASRWLVAWDFVQRPKRTFYEILADEFGPVEAQRIQRSVFICQDEFVARRLRALVKYFGGDVIAFAVNSESLDDLEGDREAERYVDRTLSLRLSRRGRRRAK